MILLKRSLTYCGSRILIMLASILFVWLLVEIGLRLVEGTDVLPGEAISNAPSDPMLGWRVRPHEGGHDANGFRNPKALTKADIVVLGDSQTWGCCASNTEETWPLQLADISGQTVYNMGIGGYGAMQYWALFPEALALEPDTILVGFYFGNDLYDTYSLVYNQNYYESWRNPDPEMQAAITEAAKTFNLDDHITFEESYRTRNIPGWLMWLSDYSIVAERAVIVAKATSGDATQAYFDANPDRGLIYEHEEIGTVLTTQYRLNVMDRNSPIIAEGFRLTLEIFTKMQLEAEAQGVRLVILLIPTKEMVYADLVRADLGTLPESYQQLVEAETAVKADLIAFFEGAGIAYLDVLPKMQAALANQQRLYRDTTDGHPTTEGYTVIAQAIADFLED